jgi:hypothetical protein
MPAKIYRIYVGARNKPERTILDDDDKIIRKTMKRYFKGWTIQEAEGIWDGAEEETRIIGVTADPTNYAIGAGRTPLKSCVAQLKNDMKQMAIMVEAGGLISML